MIRGDAKAAVRAATRFAALSPGSQESPLLLASIALSTFKPRLALQALARVDPDRGMNLAGPFYWLYQSEAAAQLEDWPRSLSMAEAGRRRFPDSPWMYFSRARALARLGRVTELEQTVAQRPARRDVLIGQARLASGMWGELRASGHRDAADRLIAHYADLLEGANADTARSGRFIRGGVLWRAGRLAQARQIFAALVARDTGEDRLADVAQLGIIEAKLGDRAGVSEVERTLANANPRYNRGEPKLLQAEVVAALGERERAVQLLRQALVLGVGLDALGGSLIGNSDLEPLFGYPSFEELIKPVG
jgi:predicted Zn-dependent protease